LKDFKEVAFADGKYRGQVSAEKLREGKGIFYYPAGDVYFGDWKQDFFHGEGVYIFRSGEIYEGALKQGLKDGFGTYYYDQGAAYYKGRWRNDQKNGLGEFVSQE